MGVNLHESLSRLTFDAKGRVDAGLVKAAAALVEASGTTPEAVEAFRDAFESLGTKGYFDAATRRAIEQTYAELVVAMPESASPPNTVEGLGARLTSLQTLVASRKAEIGTLTEQLQATEAEITAKAAQATTLLAKKQQLQAQLRDSERSRETVLLFALFGAFGAASSAVGVGSAMSLSELRRQLAELDTQIAATEKDKAALESTLSQYKAKQRVRTRELEALRAAGAGLAAVAGDHAPVDALPPEKRVAALRAAIVDTQAYAANLRAQIVLLRELNEAASGTAGMLGGTIAALQKDLSSLEARVKVSERELLGTIVDLVFKASGTPANLQLGPLSIPKKALLLDGVVGLRREVDKQIDKLVDKMITDGLVDAGTAPEIAKLVTRVLRQKPERASSAVKALDDAAFEALTEPQRLLVSAITHRQAPSSKREARIAQVLAMPTLTDVQARAAAALLGKSAASAEHNAAVDAVLADPALTSAAAARRIAEFAAARLATGELDQMYPTLRRALSFLPPDAPAARVLADAVDGSHDDEVATLRAHALAASTLLADDHVPTPESTARALRAGFKAVADARLGSVGRPRHADDARPATAAAQPVPPAGNTVTMTGTDLLALLASWRAPR